MSRGQEKKEGYDAGNKVRGGNFPAKTTSSKIYNGRLGKNKKFNQKKAKIRGRKGWPGGDAV